MIQILAETCM